MMEKIKWVGIAIVVTLVAIIVLQNLEEAETKILFFAPIKMPMAVMLFVTFVVGYLAGMVVGNPLRFLWKKAG